MIVIVVSLRWVCGPESPSTAITRHSGTLSPQRMRYSCAIRWLTAFDVTDIETLIDLIGQGLGIGLLPRPIAEMRAPGIAIAGLIEPEICWELVVAHLRCEGADPVNGAARSFLNLLEVH